MGYNTSYSLSVEADDGYLNHEDRFYGALLEMTKTADGSFDCEFEQLIDTGACYGHLYDIEEYIDGIAPNYPHLLIILTGRGEDEDDSWEKRWKGNKSEIQRAVIPPFENPNLRTEAEKSNH